MKEGKVQDKDMVDQIKVNFTKIKVGGHKAPVLTKTKQKMAVSMSMSLLMRGHLGHLFWWPR